MERDKWLDAEADMSVEARRAVLWVEVRCKKKGLPDCTTWKHRKSFTCEKERTLFRIVWFYISEHAKKKAGLKIR